MQKGEDKARKVVGFGTPSQDGALRTAGAETVFSLDDMEFLIEHPFIAIRPGQTLVMAQSNLLRLAVMRSILPLNTEDPLYLQVPGHDPIPYVSDAELMRFRAQRPVDASVPMLANRGRPSAITYTPAQADAIIREWHAQPRRKRSKVVATAARIMQMDTLKASWVRDLVLKFVGTAQRDRPAGWHGICTEIE